MLRSCVKLVRMSFRPCAAVKCTNRFEPYLVDQLYCSPRCSARMRMRAKRERDRVGSGPDGGGGKRRSQLTLFAKESISAKRVKRPVQPETAPLFTMSMNGKHEKHVAPPLLSSLCTLSVIGRCDAPKPPESVPAAKEASLAQAA